MEAASMRFFSAARPVLRAPERFLGHRRPHLVFVQIVSEQKGDACQKQACRHQEVLDGRKLDARMQAVNAAGENGLLDIGNAQ